MKRLSEILKILLFRQVIKRTKKIVQRDDAYLFLHQIGLEDICIIHPSTEKDTHNVIIGKHEIAIIMRK